MDSMSDKNTSRVEEILAAKTGNGEYSRRPLSRIEDILLNTDFGGGSGANTDEIVQTIRENLTPSDIGAVPATRTVNGKALSADLTLNAADIDAVPITRTVNGKALSSDVILDASDVGAADASEQAETDAEQDKKIDILTEILLGMDATVLRTASGNPAEISDGADDISVKNLSVEIPVTQSGSGDPYPSGGNVNLLPYPYKYTELGSEITHNGITFTDNNGIISVNGTADGDAVYRISDERTIDGFSTVESNLFRLPAGNYILSVTESGGHYTADLGNRIYMQLNTVSGATVATTKTTTGTGKTYAFTISDDEAETNLRCFIAVPNGMTVDNVQVYPMIRSAENPDAAWSPYSNVRPFEGLNSVTVTQIGRNIAPILRTEDINNGGVTAHMLGDGRYTLSGTRSTGAGVIGLNPAINLNNEAERLAEPLFVMERGVTYYVSGCQLTYRAGDPYATGALSFNAITAPSASDPMSVTPETDWYVKQIRAYSFANGSYDAQIIYEPMITTDSGKVWEPYRKQSVTVSTGDAGTVYGGNLDVTTGVLTVTHGMFRAAWGDGVPDTDIQLDSVIRKRFYLTSPVRSDNGNAAACAASLCSVAPFAPDALVYSGNPAIDFPHFSFSSLIETYPTVLSGYLSEDVAPETMIEAVYPLASPVTYQLTPQELKTILGVNHITSDAGNITLKYHANASLLYQALSADS